ncbi:DUF2399 domain-containing protein [Streptomyces sp. Inha503]|uniref:DUF2399 domain-containing protein n=1 Tax=Streptomyces sp. Inha503 TaxID=3383314 RepID=UPI0039A2BE78
MVCLQSQSSAAVITLLCRLRHHGACLLYHGDFDWGGLHIATSLLRRISWQP